MWTFYVIVEICVFLLTVMLLRHYASTEVSTVVMLSTGLSWMTAMSVVALVPIDVWATLSGSPSPRIGTLWDVSYWITFFLTWLIIPIHQGFVDAGDFTVTGRLRTSIRDNLLFWLIMIVLGVIGILLLIFWAHFDARDLPGYSIALSNAFGLLASVFLLGFGLVNIPKTLWSRSSPERSLKAGISKIGAIADKVDDACFELTTVVRVVQATQEQMPRRDPLRKYMDVIYKYAEDESPIKPNAAAVGPRGRVDLDSISPDDLDYGNDIRGLAALRRRIKRAVSVFKGVRKQYCDKVLQVQELDDVCRSIRGHDYAPRGRAPRIVWLYRCLVRPWVLRSAAVALAAVSVCVVFAEATIGVGRQPDLSPFSILVHAKENREEISLQLLVLLPLVYMCTCTYYSLFRLGIFSGFYFMVPGSTSPFSLLVNAALMCRFAPPLCYNFLHIIHVDDPNDGHNAATTFAKKMSAMDLIPLLGSKFNRWFPLVMVAYCGALALTAATGWRCLAALTPGRFAFDEEEPDDAHSERGRMLLRKEQECRAKGMPVGSGLGLQGLAQGTDGDLETRSGASTRAEHIAARGDAAAGLSAPAPRRSWWPWSGSSAFSSEQRLLQPENNTSSSRSNVREDGNVDLDNIFAGLESPRGGRIDQDFLPGR